MGGVIPSTLASKLDTNGVSDALILDADADTTISADTDDQIDVKVGGTDALRVTGTALTGNAVATIGASGTASSIAGITFYKNGDDDNSSMYTHDVSGTDNLARGNTSYGVGALDAVTTGDNITAIGNGALSASNTGVENTAIGKGAMNVSTTASYNVAVGNNAGAAMTEGDLYNVVVGHAAGTAVTTGDYNTFVGAVAGTGVTTGTNNTLIGRYAGGNFDAEDHNIAIGRNALAGAVAGGEYNLIIGNLAGDAITSADSNVFLGHQAGAVTTTGGYNTFIGGSHASYVGAANTEGSFNTFIGADSGRSNVTGTLKTIIGAKANTNANTDSHEIVIGYNVTGGGQNKVRLGSGSDYIENDYANNANWAHSSDERLKENIQTDNLGLAFINELRTTTYNWKASDKLDNSLPGYMSSDTKDFDKLCKDTSVTMNGLIAQEVKAALDKVGADDSKYGVWSTDENGIQRISESSFVMPLIKAVQELSAKVKALEDA